MLGVGLCQLIMGVLRLSFLTKYISDPLVSGFTTGAACHVFMSQVPKAMGVDLPRRSGIGMLFFVCLSVITTSIILFRWLETLFLLLLKSIQ